MPRAVFVTVGTTSFDALIEIVDDPAFVQSLASLGYTSLRVQLGRGKYTPSHFDEGGTEVRGVRCDWYRFKPTLHGDMAAAELIVSHAGAGSIIESLRLLKPLVVVVNESLMDNHQTELASAMEAERYLISATCATLQATLLGAEFSSIVPLPPPARGAFAKLVDGEMGFVSQ